MPSWTPPPEWKGQDGIIIGGGSSLKDFDFTQLKGKNVIGCNSAYKLGGDIVNICLSGDASWWEINKHELKNFTGRVVTCAPTLLPINLDWLLQMERVRDGLHEGKTLGWNYSTGAAAVNLAVSLGAIDIYLLGFDMAVVDGKSHWHNYYLKRFNKEAIVRFIRGFHTLENSLKRLPHVKVYNVTDGSSNLPVFNRITFAEFAARGEGVFA